MRMRINAGITYIVEVYVDCVILILSKKVYWIKLMKNNFQEKNNDLNDIDFQLLQIFLKYA